MNKYYWEISESDIPLIEYTNIFVGNSFWISRGLDKDVATFDLVVREMPERWGFYIFDGLERFIQILLSYKFDDDAINLLKEMNLITSPESEDFYKNFKFSGDVLAMKDGTIFFPGEPIMRITAPLCEANLITAFVLNAFTYPVRALTKITRIQLAAQNKKLAVGAGVRLPGFEQSIIALRGGYLVSGVSVSPLLHRKFPNIKPPQKIAANINHAVIKSFKNERSAYRYVFDELQDKASMIPVMVDTFDFKKGLDIFIEELKKTKSVNLKSFLVTIDSGDLKELSFYTREVLDKHGLQDIGIFVGGNLDEYKIDKHVKDGCPIDFYGLNTEYVNITDNPRLEIVYKMAELLHPNGVVEYKAKLTKGKESYPGKKQVFRIFKDNKMVEDVVGFDNEDLGVPLLQEIVKDGRLVTSISDSDFELIRKSLKDGLAQLAPEYKDIHSPEKYPVKASDKLLMETAKLVKQHIG